MVFCLMSLLAPATSRGVSPLPAHDDSQFTAAQRAEIGRIASDYLLAHPEIMLQLQQKMAQQNASHSAASSLPCGNNRHISPQADHR
ncbi:hypothetical protein JWF83_25785 [Pantoea sp. B65]